jgi:hypothetical protein
MKLGATALFAIIGSLLFAGSSAHAQDVDNAPDGEWHFLVQPYVLFPNMRGETGVGNLPNVDVDEDPSDIFHNLQMGAMLYAEARNDQWTFSTDTLYMNLGVVKISDGPAELFETDVDVSQIGWELAIMRRVTRSFELGIGMTYNQIDVDVEINVSLPGPPSQITGGLEEDWIDPTIVFRSTRPLSDDGKWFFQTRGNIGGFGVGSRLMWQLMVDVGCRPSEKWFFAFGYRVIDIDYSKGSEEDRFVYDMQTFGPQLKVGFNF